VSEPFALQVYRAIASTAEPVADWVLRRRLNRGKEIAQRVGERRGIATLARPAGPLIWLHGASVGELTSVLPLIERLHARGLDLLVTSGTVTSSKLAAQRLPHGIAHQFIPFDIPAYVRCFLDHWRPQLALFVESDLWPNMLTETAARGIPMLLTNARLSERSFERWQRFPRSIGHLLSRFELTLARTQIDADRLNALSAPRVIITGDLKLDVPAPPAEPTALAVLKAAIGNRPLLAAASTHPGEDEHVIAAHRALRHRHPNLLTVIAPRHPERGAQIAELARAAGSSCALRSQGPLPADDIGIYIADTLGELGLLYRIAPAVFIGGSLVQHGGQNPIEAAKLGAAVLHGPNVWNFAEIYAALDQAQGALQVANGETLTSAFAELLATPEKGVAIGRTGENTVRALGGGLARTLAALEPYLAKLKQQRDRTDA
jgi:3-deoxy-D-manno-octulosonic-acid transferase